jgi:hypothetical protein
MLIFYYGNWVNWEGYNPPFSFGTKKVTFDGPNRLILVNYGETELDFREDVYSAWKEWLIDSTQANSQFLPAISVIGGDPLPGNRVLGTTFFLENGWRMRTWEGNHRLSLTGNVFTREGDPVFVPTLRPWTITINLNTSTLVEAIIPTTSISAGDQSAIAQQVWSETVVGSKTAIEVINEIPTNVWEEVIDNSKNQTAGEKLRKIPTKAQNIALS